MKITYGLPITHLRKRAVSPKPPLMRLVSMSIASLLVSSILMSNSSRARAADPVAPLAPLPAASVPSVRAGSAALDVVRLKSGGMVRGTINEIVPDGDVVIVTVIGEIRH